MYKTRTSTYELTYYIVFVTKYRKEIFNTEQKREQMKDILTTLSKGNNSTIINLEVVNDHVHMIVSIPPKIAPSDIIKSYKGTSARQWFKLYPSDKNILYRGHLWSPSFFIRSIGSVSKEIVLQYVKNQLKKDW